MSETHLSKTTRIFHWSIAITVIALLAVGLYMKRAEAFQFYDIHKSIGTLIFALIIARVIWRVMKGWPSQASNMPNWQKTLSRLVHWVLIIGTVLMPLTGLIGTYYGGRDISIFGLIITPEVPGPEDVIPRNEELGDLMFLGHEYIAYIMIIALALHIAGAVKHHFIDKDGTLRRMIVGQ